jgi:hypothetical protein
MSSHDPERSAAEYLGGRMSGRRRRAFEEHVIDCEECWREVDLGRAGRTAAESGREIAPQALRERLRASVATLTPPPRRLHWGALAGAAVLVLVASVGAWVATSERQPAEIQAVIADFKGPARLGTSTPPSLPRRLGDLRLLSARTGTLHGMSIVTHYYEDAAGHVVGVYRSDASFPIADDARHATSRATWTATEDGLVMFCTDEPVAYLIVGDDDHEVDMAVEQLGLE